MLQRRTTLLGNRSRSLGYRSRSQSALKHCAQASVKLVHVRTVSWSCMVGFENKLVQMIIMTIQSVMKKNHVVRSKVYVTVCTLCIDFSETCLCLPITWSSMLAFIYNVAQMIIITRGCVADKNMLLAQSSRS